MLPATPVRRPQWAAMRALGIVFAAVLAVGLVGAALAPHLSVVADDGKGLANGAPIQSGFGLVSMRERAEALGGSVEIGPRPHRGVQVVVRLP